MTLFTASVLSGGSLPGVTLPMWFLKVAESAPPTVMTISARPLFPSSTTQTLAFVGFTVFPLVALLAAIVVSLHYVRRLESRRLYVVIPIFGAMAIHQGVELGRFAAGMVVSTSLVLELSETSATLLTASTVLLLLAYVRERQRETAKLDAEMGQLSTILDNVHDAVFFVDVDADEIFDVNNRACELLGYERDELLSLGVSDVHPDEMDRVREFAASVERDGSGEASDLHCLRADGRKIPVDVSACAAEFRDRQALVVSVRDVSSLERQNHYLKVFDRVLRHNLRNGMNVVLGRAEYIGEYADDDRLIELSETLCQTAEELVEIADDIRHVQRSIRNELPASHQFDCATMLGEIAEEVRADHPTATVTTDLPDSLRVRADSRLRVAVEHVVENAVVHHDGDYPNVEVRASVVDRQDYVEVQVVDDGPGIPESERLVAMNPDDTTPLEHGTGVGLWVASTIVHSFDGHVRIEDNDPRGSIVRMTLPRSGPSIETP